MSTTVRRSAIPAARLCHDARGRFTTVLSALIAGIIGWTIAGPALNVPLRVRVTPSAPVITVASGSVAVVSVLAGLAGWGLLVLLGRVTSNVRRVWTIVAVAVLLVSLAGPLRGVHTSTVAALVCLHVLVGAVLIVGFRRSASR